MRLLLLSAAALAACCPAALPAQDLAGAIPTDARAALFVKSPLKLAERLEKLASDSGAPALPVSLENLLAQALPEGLVDWKRPAALTLLDFKDDLNAALVAHAADPANPFAKAGGKEGDHGVREIEHRGETLFAFANEGLIVVAPRAELLKGFRKTGKGMADLLAGAFAEPAGKADAFAVYNAPAAAAELSAKLEDAVKVLEAAGDAAPKNTVMQAQLFAGLARSLLKDTARAGAGLYLDDTGASLRGFAEFRPESDVAKAIQADAGAAPTEPFAGLPDRPSMAALFFDNARMKTMLLKVSEAAAPHQPDKAAAERNLANGKVIAESILTGSSFLSVEKGKFAQFQRNVPRPGADPAKLIAAVEDAMAEQMKASAGGEGGAKSEVKSSKETLGGIEYTRSEIVLSGLPEPVGGILEKMFGKPVVMHQGFAKDGALLSFMNADPLEWSKPAKSYVANPIVAAATAKLGAKPLFAALVDPFGVMELVHSALPFPIPLPPHLLKRPEPPVPPIGFSMLALEHGFEMRMRYESATGRALSGQPQ